MSNSRPEDSKNSGDNVFKGMSVSQGEASLFADFLNGQDLAPNSRRAFKQDVRKFACWFSLANKEPFKSERVTVRDITDFKSFLRTEKKQAVATVNRCLVTLRRFFGWLLEHELVSINPAKPVKELRRQQLAPKGLERTQVRKLLREIELRNDIRANAIFSMFLWTGARCGDLTNLELDDIMLAERSGSAVFRTGKGNKQRTVPIPLAARRPLIAWLESRPPVQSSNVFVGERGALTEKGYRNLCDKYSAICGFKIHPHLLRHSFAHRFLADNGNDLVALAQILGHENLNTTKRYVQKTQDELGEASDRLSH
jgi:site-specific recombinase XerD